MVLGGNHLMDRQSGHCILSLLYGFPSIYVLLEAKGAPFTPLSAFYSLSSLLHFHRIPSIVQTITQERAGKQLPSLRSVLTSKGPANRCSAKLQTVGPPLPRKYLIPACGKRFPPGSSLQYRGGGRPSL